MSAIKFAVSRLTPSRLKPVPQSRALPEWRCARAFDFSGTGFSREEASVSAIKFAVSRLTLSRLKPVPLTAAR